nr:hypothetical protein [Tanacetum cinerariifolium]
MEIVIPEVGGIDDDILLMIKDGILRKKLRNVNLLISKIEALNANPTPSFDSKTKSSSTFLNSLLEETNTFDNSLPEFETFCFDVEEISSGSTTTDPDLSLLEYEAFYDDHVKEISSGSPTTPSDISLSEYDSFMFDLSVNPFPHADRSDSYEFIDELIPFIPAPEYDCFRFTVESNSRDFTKDVVKNISPTKEPLVLIVLPTHPTLQLNLKSSLLVNLFSLMLCGSSFFFSCIQLFLPIFYPYGTKISFLILTFARQLFLSRISLIVVQKKLEKKQIKEERAAKAKYWKLPVCYDDDDDEERPDSLNDNIISGLPPFSAITPDEPVLSTEEPNNSLRMGDEHLDTIPAMESDEFINPTTHSDSSLYASFVFDLSINPFPPADRKDSYEFTDELIPFISAPEYDCLLFKVEPNSRDFTKDVVEDISPMKEPQILNALPTHPSFQLNMKFPHSSESLFAYVVWIFLPFLVYSVVPPYLLSLRNEDIIFDPGICKSTFSRPDISHRCRTVKKFNTHRSHLNKCPMLIHGQNNPPLDVLLFHFYPL